METSDGEFGQRQRRKGRSIRIPLLGHRQKPIVQPPEHFESLPEIGRER